MSRSVGTAAIAVVEVAIVERRKDDTLPNTGNARRDVDQPPPRLQAHEIALLDPERSSVGRSELHPRSRRRPVELGRATRLGPGVEVVEGATGGKCQRVIHLGLFVGRLVLRGAQNRASV